MAQFKFGPRRIKKEVQMDDFSLTLLSVILIAIAAIILITAIYGIIFAVTNVDTLLPLESIAENSGDHPYKQNVTLDISNDTENASEITGISGKYAVLIDVTTGEVKGTLRSGQELNPASMTKVMTLIVVMENLSGEGSLNDMVTVTDEHISHKTSERKMSGVLGGEAYPAGEYSVKTLLNHLIMDSSGVAALALADYIAGSEANFVKLMNEKAEEMELERTKFVYCDGSHSLGHKSTARDMAKIMAYAMKNTYCANILNSLSYSDEDGNIIYHKPLVHNYYIQNPPNVEKKPTNAKVVAAKSGWTGDIADGDWSGGCMVTYLKGNDGHEYVVVVAGTPGGGAASIASAVDDTVAICNAFIK